ncbi:MAG: 3-isopropylmalate dehydrogenase, partial [Bacteroidales bacterium]|nr:3-isopropylmalate dehydrogenase [Bacteroidales bacterium]
IHGSYPQAAGNDIANPLATVLSAAMLLELSLNLIEEAKAVRDVVDSSLEQGIVTEDISERKAYKTSEVGDWLAENL